MRDLRLQFVYIHVWVSKMKHMFKRELKVGTPIVIVLLNPF
jgi:hypothetical protein